MAHKRKDTYVSPPEWWDHLRPYNKRRLGKMERLAAKRLIGDLIEEEEEDHPDICNGDNCPICNPSLCTPPRLLIMDKE